MRSQGGAGLSLGPIWERHVSALFLIDQDVLTTKREHSSETVTRDIWFIEIPTSEIVSGLFAT